MLTYTNKIIDLHKFTEVSGKSSYVEFATSIGVYFEPASDEVSLSYEGQAGYEVFTLITDRLDFDIGDKVIVGTDTYKIKGVKKFDSLVGKQSECIIVTEYD